MTSATIRPFLLALALPACLAVPGWAGDESIKEHFKDVVWTFGGPLGLGCC